MLITSRVIDFNNEVHNLNVARKEEDKAISKCLSPFKRLMLEHINTLISNISHTIEEQSGWTYTPEFFMSKTDYSYNYHTNEITFTVNKADINHPDCSSPIIEEFIKNYQGLLNRLTILEQKRSRIIKPYQKNYNSFIIDFNKALEQKKEKTNKIKDLEYLSIASQDFIDKYGIDGIKRLVKLLNELTLQDKLNPQETYNRQFRGNITNLYVDELFRWASSFTPRAQYIRDFIERKRWESEQALTDDLRRAIR